MQIILALLLLLVLGAFGGIIICSLFEGNEGFNGYAAMMGMIVSLLSGILIQLDLMHKDKR